MRLLCESCNTFYSPAGGFERRALCPTCRRHTPRDSEVQIIVTHDDVDPLACSRAETPAVVAPVMQMEMEMERPRDSALSDIRSMEVPYPCMRPRADSEIVMLSGGLFDGTRALLRPANRTGDDDPPSSRGRAAIDSAVAFDIPRRAASRSAFALAVAAVVRGAQAGWVRVTAVAFASGAVAFLALWGAMGASDSPTPPAAEARVIAALMHAVQGRQEPRQPLADLDRAAARAAITRAAGEIGSCRAPGDAGGTAKVSITFAPSGKVTAVRVVSPPMLGTETQKCIAKAFANVQVAAFAGGPAAFLKEVTLR